MKQYNSTSGCLSKEFKSGPQRDTCTPMFIAALITIAKTRKQCKCPWMHEWMKKMWCRRCTVESYSAIKKMKILTFLTT